VNLELLLRLSVIRAELLRLAAMENSRNARVLVYAANVLALVDRDAPVPSASARVG